MRAWLFRTFCPTAYHLLELRKEVRELQDTVEMHDFYLYSKDEYVDLVKLFQK